MQDTTNSVSVVWLLLQDTTNLDSEYVDAVASQPQGPLSSAMCKVRLEKTPVPSKFSFGSYPLPPFLSHPSPFLLWTRGTAGLGRKIVYVCACVDEGLSRELECVCDEVTASRPGEEQLGSIVALALSLTIHAGTRAAERERERERERL